MPPDPWSGALACALYKQETVVRAVVEALFEIFAEKMDWAQILCRKADWIEELLENVCWNSSRDRKKVLKQLLKQLLQQMARDLTRPGQGPAIFDTISY